MAETFYWTGFNVMWRSPPVPNDTFGRASVRLLYGLQCHPTFFRFKKRDRERIHLAELELRAQFVFAAEFGDVDEPRNAFLYRSECTMFVVFDDDGIYALIFLVLRQRPPSTDPRAVP